MIVFFFFFLWILQACFAVFALTDKNKKKEEICVQFSFPFGEKIVAETVVMIRVLLRETYQSDINISNQPQSGRPSTNWNENLENVRREINEDRTIDSRSEETCYSWILDKRKLND